MLEVLRVGPALARARCSSASSMSSRAGSGSRRRGRGLERHGRASPRVSAAMAWGRGDEVVTSPFSFVASANCLLYEGAKPVFCDIDPATLNIDPEAAAAACGDRTVGLLPVHLFGYPADMPALESARRAAAASGSSRTPARRLGAVDAEGVKVGARGQRGRVRLLRQQAARDGGGRHADRGRPRRWPSALAASETRDAATDMARDRARPARLQLPALRRRGRDRRRAARARRSQILAERARVAALYRERLERDRGLRASRPRAVRRERRSWFVYVVQLPERRRPRRA